MRAAVACALAVIGAASTFGTSQAGGSLKVRPLVVPAPPTAGAQAVPGTAPSAKDGVPQRFRRQVEQRIERWRSFPDLISHPRVDWSPASPQRRRPAKGPIERTLLDENGKLLPERIAGVAGVPPVPDTQRVAFIRIEFTTDRNGSETSGNGRFDLSNPGAAAPPIDRPPHHRTFYQAHLTALNRYFDSQSYGGVVVTGEVWPRSENGAYRCTDMADFGPWQFNQEIYRAAVHMFRSMLFAADTQSTDMGDRIPWKDIDHVVLIHAGSDLQSDVAQDSPLDIPSFTIGVGDTDVVIFNDNGDSSAWLDYPIDRAMVVPETINQDGYFGTVNGVIAHEAGHLLFGLSDLYDTVTGLPTVGLWSLMDSGNLVGSIVVLPDQTELFATGLLPPSVDPWQRAFVGNRLRFQEVAWGATNTLLASERHPDMRVALMTSDEYVIFENRYLAPADSVELDQDDSTRVVLGPKKPDRHEYDALLPGGGILAWHIDESVIPNEYYFPCDSARHDPECGFNTQPGRRAISIIEGDALQDLGDLNSPYLLGAPRDPWYRSNNAVLADSTRPPLRPHIGTRPHMRFEFLDEPDSVMRFVAQRMWQLPNWPLAVDQPQGGAVLTPADLDGDGRPEVCWAGGAQDSPDSTAIFAFEASGVGAYGTGVLSRVLSQRPRPEMAVVHRPGGAASPIAALVVSTRSDTTGIGAPGGEVWLIDRMGDTVDGWPFTPPAPVTTPPVVGFAPDTTIYVGAADGVIYALRMDGTIRAQSAAQAGPITGRLAVYTPSIGDASGFSTPVIAAGTTGGLVVVLVDQGTALSPASGWPQPTGVGGLIADFLWIDFGGIRPPAAASDCFRGALSLIAHHADRLWGWCSTGQPLPGWGRALGDTIVPGLGAGDPDGDGLPEVLTHSVSSRVTYWNLTGYPSPGWPKRGTTETFRSAAPPVAMALDGGTRTHVITSNASGIVEALDGDGVRPPGWPLATGLDAGGAPMLVDLDGEGSVELVVSDGRNGLYAYALPAPASALARTSWPMLGGDPFRSSALPAARNTTPPVASSGPLVDGSLKAYPNPARRRPVSFAYTLTEPADVQFRIVNTAGHEVAAFSRVGRIADNVEQWDPGDLPAGLYMARVRIRGQGTEHVEMMPIGILR